MRLRAITAAFAVSLIVVGCNRPVEKETSPSAEASQNVTGNSATLNPEALSTDKPLLIVQSDDGGLLFTDVPNGIDVSTIPNGGPLPPESEQALRSFVFGDETEKGCCGVTIRWRVVVRQNTTVRGTSVTVGRPTVVVEAPEVTVDGVRMPEIRIGPPDLSENPYPPEYDVRQECKISGSDAEVYVRNNEKKDLAVVLLIGGMVTPPQVVRRQSARMFGKFSNQTCEYANRRVQLLRVET